MRSQPPQGEMWNMAEREKNGRFAKGNSGGPGNPYAGQVAKLRAVVLACLPEETMRVIVQAMIRQAMRGDVAAAKLLFQYALGKPIEVPLPEAEVAEPEEDAVNKREETEAEEQPSTVNKREETAAQPVNKRRERDSRTESKREETDRRTVNKRRETEGSATMGDAGDGSRRDPLRELLGLLLGAEIEQGCRGGGSG